MFIVIENDTEMSETDPFYSEEADGMSKRTQLEEYFSQSLEVDLLLRLCPDDEDNIYQIVDLLVDTCATNRKLLRIAGDDMTGNCHVRFLGGKAVVTPLTQPITLRWWSVCMGRSSTSALPAPSISTRWTSTATIRKRITRWL